MGVALEQVLADERLLGVRIRGADWPRRMMRRMSVPPGWVALREQPSGVRELTRAGETPEIEPDDTLLLLRQPVVELPLAARRLQAADEHRVDATCALRLGLPADRDSAAAFGRLITTGDRVTSDQLAERFRHAGGQAALERLCAGRAAAELVGGLPLDEVTMLLRAALEAVLFETGCELEQVTAARFESASFDAAQAAQQDAAVRVARYAARAEVDRAARAALDRRLADVAAVLERLQGLADEQRGASLEQLLSGLGPEQRGRLFEHLWRVMPTRVAAHRVAVVAGPRCVLLDPEHPDGIAGEVTVPESLGALRSVDYDAVAERLLIGAARGVWVVDRRGDVPAQAFEVTTATAPRTGFNGAVVAGDTLYATHSQFGLWRWRLDAPEAGSGLLEPAARAAKTVRSPCVAADGATIFFGVDESLVAWRTEDERLEDVYRFATAIQSVAVAGERVFIGTSGGSLWELSADGSAPARILFETSAALESAVVRSWPGIDELLVPAGRRGVVGLFGREAWNAVLLRPDAGARRVAASDDLLVALSPARDRLILSRQNDTETVGQLVVPVAQWLGHSIQDMAVITRQHEVA
jgi:hypothetical protein